MSFFDIEAAIERRAEIAKLAKKGNVLAESTIEEFEQLDADISRYRQGWRGDNDMLETRGGSRNHSTARDADFSDYLRTGRVGPSMQMRPETRAELDSASLQTIPGQGGYMIPQGFWMNLQVALKQYGGLANHFRVVETDSGTEMPWPTVNPTGITGAYITEANQVGFTDYVFGQGVLYGWTVTSGVILASLQLVNDSAFNVDQFVGERIGEAIGRKYANEALNGAGSASKAFTGLVTAINAYGQTTTQPSGGYYTLGSATQVKTFTNTSGSSELLQNVLSPATVYSVIGAVDSAYWPNSAWYMSPAQALNMHTIIDSNGRPLLEFANGLENGLLTNSNDATSGNVVIGSLAGFPVYVDANISALTASTTTGPFFGDMSAGMVRRVVTGGAGTGGVSVLRLTERYADYLQVGYLGFSRGDFQPNDLRAVVAVRANST